ncbi:hypothetical protein [Absidia glauca]|uniref:Uncharacterized protein n=1 Tax=Absidia glauca TaxID=4829 RepID=A0A163IXQ9_ABSGL|nr:hypothetical protein [Absidia glauca]
MQEWIGIDISISDLTVDIFPFPVILTEPHGHFLDYVTLLLTVSSHDTTPTHGGKSGSSADHDLEEFKAYVEQKRRQHNRVDDRRQRRHQRSQSRSGSRDNYRHHHNSKHYQQYRRDHQHRGGNGKDRNARSSGGAPYPKQHKNKTWTRDSRDDTKPTDSYGKKFFSMKSACDEPPHIA